LLGSLGRAPYPGRRFGDEVPGGGGDAARSGGTAHPDAAGRDADLNLRAALVKVCIVRFEYFIILSY
jgi:hypothetical protein